MADFVNRRDLRFLLCDWLDIEALFSRDRFAAYTLETMEAALDLAERLGTDLLLPSLRSGDSDEPRIDEKQNVVVNPKVGSAVKGIIASGLFGAVFDEELGGLQMPFLAYMAAMGILHSASSSATFYMMLTVGNARLIISAEDRLLIDHFAIPQIAGDALGTMCLSEPQAGSSLADITARAVWDQHDEIGERYRIFGNKMWISGGDQNVTDNIIHLVLAKVPDADGHLSAGSQGISLFVVPKKLPSSEANDVVVAGLNHKMGSRALSNCALNFGEGHANPEGQLGAIGWRVGKVGQGLPLMFQMMNEARISVGMASAMTAYRGYLISLGYACERLQGRLADKDEISQVRIIEHLDVRRMLLAQKVIAEGGLALTLFAARLQDEQMSAVDEGDRKIAAAILGLLTPIAKSWPAEFGQVSLGHAIQVLGGAGYTRDFEVELLYRDNRLNPIHEGTTGIQALDLVGRKIRKDRGAAYRLLCDRVDQTHQRAAAYSGLQAVLEASSPDYS